MPARTISVTYAPENTERQMRPRKKLSMSFGGPNRIEIHHCAVGEAARTRSPIPSTGMIWLAMKNTNTNTKTTGGIFRISMT